MNYYKKILFFFLFHTKKVLNKYERREGSEPIRDDKKATKLHILNHEHVISFRNPDREEKKRTADPESIPRWSSSPGTASPAWPRRTAATACRSMPTATNTGNTQVRIFTLIFSLFCVLHFKFISTFQTASSTSSS